MEDATIRVKTKVDNADLNKFGDNFVSKGKEWGSIIGNVSSALGKMALKLGVVGLLVKGISALVNMAKEGFKNLAQTGGEYNKVMSDFKSQAEQLKNALATAFEPIVVTIIPYLTKLCEWLTTAADYMAQFFAVISGKNSYQKAKKQTIDYASTLKKTTSEAKKALATFDELNVLTSQNSGSNTSGGAATGADAFETVNIEGWENLKKIRDAVTELIEVLSPKLKTFWNEVLVPVAAAMGEKLKEACGLASEGFSELALAAKSYLEGDTEGALEHLQNAGQLFKEAWGKVIDGIKIGLDTLLRKLEEVYGFNFPQWIHDLLAVDEYKSQNSTDAQNAYKKQVLQWNSMGRSTLSTMPDSARIATQKGIASAYGVSTSDLVYKHSGDDTINLNINLDGDVVYNSVVERQKAKSRAAGHSF